MKRCGFFALLLPFLLMACHPAEKPIFGQREFIDLSGVWRCDSGEIRLPGTIDEGRITRRTTDTLSTAQLTRLYPYMGKMSYYREIEIPEAEEFTEWRLIMERTKPSTVWIDGVSVGSSALLLSPQVYPLGKLAAGKHTLRIEIDNSPAAVPPSVQGSHAWSEATQTSWNGIIGKFGLEANSGIFLKNIQVHPSVSSSVVPVEAQIQSPIAGKCIVKVSGYTWNAGKQIILPEESIELFLEKGLKSYLFYFNAGEQPILWSEFCPALYKVNFALTCGNRQDYLTVDFGIRTFSTSGTQFTINSLKTFLRGKHDACVFPLTGYPPMEKEEWIRQFRIAKQYGINHYRFHSWTPPQAAFDAANEEGIYLQAELPFGGHIGLKNNKLLVAESEQLLDAYGNNPSFVMMALGNELHEDVGYMREVVDKLRAFDGRRLYAFGSNNYLGTMGLQEGEDFFVTCRVGGEVGSNDYSMHTRASFAFVDAKEGGYLNGQYPSTDVDFSKAVAACAAPIISHENGQFQAYPDYAEIAKYQGVLYPYSLEVFQRRLNKNGLQEQAEDFHRATARFSALCYKADIEMCLRTGGFGGFQLLDLQDYPGQGSAYVGILDAFMDSKGGMAAEEFRGFCSEIVPLALFPQYCWRNSDTLAANIKVCNYSERDLSAARVAWNLTEVGSKTVIAKGKFRLDIPQGTLTEAGQIEVALSKIAHAAQLRLTLKVNNRVNGYDFWVYPNEENDNPLDSSIVEVALWDEAAEQLKQGKKVLFVPDHQAVANFSVGGMFTPDYWNYAMFKRISEGANRDVSPGTLSILTYPLHPLFQEFPTDFCSNWQWWIISKNSRPYILDQMPKDYKPLVQVVDNVERNHKLGLLFEMQVGEGKLLVSACNLKAIAEKPEGQQLRRAIYRYMSSDAFAPQATFAASDMKRLLETLPAKQEIIGVENVTDYR